MTATPMPKQYTLKELVNVRTATAKWENAEVVKCHSTHCEDVKGAVVSLINFTLQNNNADENLYFFVNSVKFINSVVRACNLNNDNTRMIVSKNNDAKKLLKNSTVDDAPKKINFITSSCFEGCDIFDTIGRSIIVSDGSSSFSSHTLVDISTTLPQICGRIRNSIYKNEVYHLYSTTRYSNLDEAQFKAMSDEDAAIARSIVERFNNDSVLMQHAKPDNIYIRLDEQLQKYIFDENAKLYDEYLFNLAKGVYSSQIAMRDELYKNNIDAAYYTDYHKYIDAAKEAAKLQLTTFTNVVKYLKRIDEVAVTDAVKLQYSIIKSNAAVDFPLVVEAIERLGFSRIGTLKYNQTAIEKELKKTAKEKSTNVDAKVFKSLNLKSREYYTNKELKDRLKSIYKECGITSTAKATDITKYYDAQKSNKRVNGKFTEGYQILRPKYTIK